MHLSGSSQQEILNADRQGLATDAALLDLQDVLCDRAWDASSLADLRFPLQSLCACARREHLPPEWLLVRLRETLETVYVQAGVPPDTREDLTRRLITLAIEAYFAATA